GRRRRRAGPGGRRASLLRRRVAGRTGIRPGRRWSCFILRTAAARCNPDIGCGLSYDRCVADRILVYGVTGSGKTTTAAHISERTGLPWHSVDDLTWEPGWVEVPVDEQRRRIAAICAGERWILDTAYGTWREIPLARADLIVALDYPRWISLG